MKAALEPSRAAREKARKESEARARKDPDLLHKVTIIALQTVADPQDPKKTTQRYSDLSACLEQLAEASGLSVLGDYDPCWDDYYSWQNVSRPGTRHKTYMMQDLRNVPVWQALDFLAERFDITWEKKGGFVHIRSPRVLYAEMDGIDMLEHRPPGPPRLPGGEEGKEQSPASMPDPTPG